MGRIMRFFGLLAFFIAVASCKSTSNQGHSGLMAELRAKDPSFGEYSNAYYDTVQGDSTIKVLHETDLTAILADDSGKYDDSRFLVGGDMVLTGDQVRKLYSKDLDLSAEVCKKGERWPDAVIPYDVSEINDESLLLRIKNLVGGWATFGITWRPRVASDKSYVKFQTSAEGCWADIGFGTKIRTLNLGPGCNTPEVVVHEMGHSMGLHHEQSRPDRDAYVTVYPENILPGDEHNFKKQGCFDQTVPYDYKSVMHYSSYAFTKQANLMTMTKKDGSEIKRPMGMTMGDIQTLKNLYGTAPVAGGARYTNWAPGAGNGGPQSSCTILKASGKWEDTPCYQEFLFACQNSSNPKDWKISDKKAPFQAHKGKCPTGYTFSTPRNADENQALIGAAAGKTVWMSFNDVMNEGSFTDASPFE
jgi:hypothetical protein